MPGFVHVVDDDASFRTAMERRLKKAGYGVATYPSAQHLLDRLTDERIRLHPPRRANTGAERSGAPRAPERTQLDVAYHIPYWLSRCSDHGADHQGGCGGFSDQARIVG